jgi:hypothetical protein
MSKPEDEPEIMLEVCVDSVDSAKAYVAFCNTLQASKVPSINAPLALSMEVPNAWKSADRWLVVGA